MKIKISIKKETKVESILSLIKATIGSNYLNFSPISLQIKELAGYLELDSEFSLLVKMSKKSPQKKASFDSKIKSLLVSDELLLEKCENQVEV